MGGGREPGKAIQLSPPKTMSMDLTEALIDIEERLRDMLEYGLGKPTAFVSPPRQVGATITIYRDYKNGRA